MKSKEQYWGYIFSWIFGLIFLLIGVLNVAFSPFLSIALVLLGLLLLPSINMELDKSWHLQMTHRIRNAFFVIFVIIGILIIASMCGWFYCVSV